MKMANPDFYQMQQTMQNAREMQKRALPPPQSQSRQNPLNGIFNSLSGLLKDSDTILILAMILLLSRDGGDKMLIFALLYIMS